MFLFLMGCLQSDFSIDKPTSVFSAPDVYRVSSVNHKSNKSSIKILIMDDDDEAGHGSGNYFVYRGHDFILTAAHVVDTEKVVKIVDDGDDVLLKVIYINYDNDVAILIPSSPLRGASALKWKANRDADMLGDEVVYSGYPSHYGKLLIRGMVSSSVDTGIIVQSFALPGSSGSVVFDSSGRVVGVVSAVGLHQSSFSPFPSLQEDMVFVSRIDKITNKILREVLECGD